MGTVLSIYERLWAQNMELVVVGLDNAGKSSLLNLLVHGHHVDSTPTVSFLLCYKIISSNSLCL